MVLPEKRLLWHPRQENKFAIGGGSQITLYEWAKEHPRIRHVTSQQDLQYMKCFAWSPDPSLDDLVAVGVNSGRVDLIRLEAAKQNRGERLTSGPTVSLSVRNSRTCNSVAFCAQDTNLLAAGLDKVRGDCSLLIWDITTATPLLSLDTTNPHDVALSNSTAQPQPSIPRMTENNPRHDPRILQQYAPQEIVSCLTFLPKSSHLVLTGISYRWLRLFDLRSQAPNVLSVPGKIQSIATDPFDQYRVATVGDNNISIWDTRRLSSALMFSERDATADNARLRAGSVYSTIEFSSTRRGCLATLEKDSAYVRFWDLMDTSGPSNEIVSNPLKEMGKAPAKRSWASTLSWQTSGTQTPSAMKQRTSSSDFTPSSLVLANTRRTKTFPKILSSFALAPDPSSPHPLTSNVMVVNKEGDLEMYAIWDAPKQSGWSSRGDLAFGSGVNLKTIPGMPDNDLDPDIPGRALKSQSLPPVAPPIPVPALFGRGDEEGFPALPSVAATGLAATRPQKGRTYSPSALRKYQSKSHESSERHQTTQGSVRQLSLSREPPPMSGEHGLIGEKLESEKVKKRSKLRDGKNKEFVSAVEDDISMLMRRRAIIGYGLSRPQHNMWITREEYDPLDVNSQALSDLWAWISHSQQLLCTPTARVNGYDFAHQGILGVWDGISPMQSQLDVTPTTTERPLFELGNTTSFPTHERRSRRSYSQSQTDDSQAAFQAALAIIESRKTGERSTWKPVVSTVKLAQRQVAMKLCGWSLKEDELSAAILKWEKEGQHTRAAAWLVFTRQFSRALDTLLKSNDMSHKMMSGTIAALIPHASSGGPLRNHELREHCERLIKDIKDPYFCAIITYLAVGDWADVLREESIPLRERLAIALQFLDDKALTIYLRHVVELAVIKGTTDGLIVTGLTNRGMDILQSYINNTGDVQTAAILGSVLFDIERGQILTEAMQSGDIPPMELVPKQIMIRCNYCSKPVVPEEDLQLVEQAKWKPTTCSNCQKALPRCSVCLLTLSIIPDAAREIDLVFTPQKDTIDDAVVICQSCRHGGHASHLMGWFFGEGERSRGVCPVADCDCRCADEF
ncbi:SEH-associated protein 4 [Leucoagaricus sp. SymC.cos]|nr:SEH-associated protein 4 [Leucoagaricus sp. SymC.cos]